MLQNHHVKSAIFPHMSRDHINQEIKNTPINFGFQTMMNTWIKYLRINLTTRVKELSNWIFFVELNNKHFETQEEKTKEETGIVDSFLSMNWQSQYQDKVSVIKAIYRIHEISIKITGQKWKIQFQTLSTSTKDPKYPKKSLGQYTMLVISPNWV